MKALWLFLMLLLPGMAFAQPLLLRAHTSDPYRGPCNVVSCAEAYSVTRGMVTSYSGNLFQLVRASDGTTLNVGQTTAHVVDISSILAFCAKTFCNIQKVYAQINGTDLIPPNSSGGIAPGNCITASACAPPFFMDPGTGLPIVRTLFPTELYNSTSATGVTGGTNAASVWMYGRNEGWSTCCGLFGYAHPYTTTPLVDGTDFLPGYGYGNGHAYINCASATTVCAKIDIETFATDGADYSPNSLQDVNYLATWGGSGANTMKVYINSSTPIYNSIPAATMNVPTMIRIGAGGDGSHVDGIFREGLISNAVLSTSDYTALASNVSGFYGATSPNACRSTADFGYYFASGSGTSARDYALSSTLAGYALRRLSASYFGPIADLRDATGTTNTYGPSPTGCGIDPAAATFCALHAPCTVSKLYNQGTWSSANLGNVHDTLLDLVQATVANQPQVNFTGQNGIPTMAFAGAQSMCTEMPAPYGSYFTLVGAVAKRTGAFASYNVIVNANLDADSIGFSNAPDNAYSFFRGIFASGGTLTDNAWHSIIAENLFGATPQTILYGDGVSLGGGSSSSYFTTNKVCIGVVLSGDPSFLTGEIGEVTIVASGTPTESSAQVNTLYTLQKAAWAVP